MQMDQAEEYEMWHDEYKCPNSGAYVHGILLIPCNRKKEIIKILGDLRKELKKLKEERQKVEDELERFLDKLGY